MQLLFPLMSLFNNYLRVAKDDQGVIHLQSLSGGETTLQDGADIATVDPISGAFATPHSTIDDGQGNQTVGGDLVVNGAKVDLHNAATSTSAPAAGSGAALPATPAGYVTVYIGGAAHQIAYY